MGQGGNCPSPRAVQGHAPPQENANRPMSMRVLFFCMSGKLSKIYVTYTYNVDSKMDSRPPKNEEKHIGAYSFGFYAILTRKISRCLKIAAY